MMSLHTVCMEMAFRDLRVKNESDYRAYQEYPAFCILQTVPYEIFKETYAKTRHDLHERLEHDLHFYEKGN